LTIGLSKETLNKLGFRFKEDIVVESKVKLGEVRLGKVRIGKER
jgi:hypothetical protein